MLNAWLEMSSETLSLQEKYQKLATEFAKVGWQLLKFGGWSLFDWLWVEFDIGTDV